MGRELMAPRTDRTTRIPSAVASPVTTNHAAKGSVFVNLPSPGNLKNCSTYCLAPQGHSPIPKQVVILNRVLFHGVPPCWHGRGFKGRRGLDSFASSCVSGSRVVNRGPVLSPTSPRTSPQTACCRPCRASTRLATSSCSGATRPPCPGMARALPTSDVLRCLNRVLTLIVRKTTVVPCCYTSC